MNRPAHDATSNTPPNRLVDLGGYIEWYMHEEHSRRPEPSVLGLVLRMEEWQKIVDALASNRSAIGLSPGDDAMLCYLRYHVPPKYLADYEALVDRLRSMPSAIEQKLNPAVLPALPGQKSLTVVMHKDDGDVQADDAIAAIQRGDTFMVPQGVSELFLHQLRLRVILDPSLIDKIAVYYLIPGERRYAEISLTDTLKWPVGFCQEGWEIEMQITAAKCDDDANPIAVKKRDELRAKYQERSNDIQNEGQR